MLEGLREKLAPDVPIIATLDLHANVTDRMAEHATALFSYRTYPHVDMRERGKEAAQLMARCLAGECRPVTVVSRAPLLVGCDDGRTTGTGQMIDHLAEARRLEREEPGVLTISVNAGFVDADIEQAGAKCDRNRQWRLSTLAAIGRRHDGKHLAQAGRDKHFGPDPGSRSRTGGCERSIVTDPWRSGCHRGLRRQPRGWRVWRRNGPPVGFDPGTGAECRVRWAVRSYRCCGIA